MISNNIATLEDVRKKINSKDCSDEIKAAYSIGLSCGFMAGLDEAKEDALPELSCEDQAYRRGFSQGFFVGRTNTMLTQQEILAWRHSKKRVGAPGTPSEGKPL
jgi:hypothetical protein